MAKLTTKKRKKLPNSAFALPKKRKYPIKKVEDGKLVPDKAHAINAKARATQMEKKGYLTASEAARVKMRADRVLKKAGVKILNSKKVKKRK